jgi:hypothetical protein
MDGEGCIAAVARFDGRGASDVSDASDAVDLGLQLGPVRPPLAVVGELVRSVAALAADAGAERIAVDLDPECRFAANVLAASGLDWQIRPTCRGAVAEARIGDAGATEAASMASSASVVRARPRGVTVLPTAEGPSPRSDPRWTARRAHRSERLLEHLASHGRR